MVTSQLMADLDRMKSPEIRKFGWKSSILLAKVTAEISFGQTHTRGE